MSKNTFTFKYNPTLTPEKMFADFWKATEGKLNTVEPHTINSNNLEVFLENIDKDRLRLFGILTTKKPSSLTKLAKLLGRDYDDVLHDVHVLEGLGVIQLHKKDKEIEPIALYEEIKFEFKNEEVTETASHFSSFISKVENLVGKEKVAKNSKLAKDIEKSKLMSALKELMDDWSGIYKRDKGINRENANKVIGGAQTIVKYLKELELMCLNSNEKLDNRILEWIREKKPQYESMVFRGRMISEKMEKLNNELMLVKVDSESRKGHLFVIFQEADDHSVAQEQFLLLETLSEVLSQSTDRNGNCNIYLLFDALWQISCSSVIPFVYAFSPAGKEEIAREVIIKGLIDLTAEKLSEIHFSKREKEDKQLISVSKLTVKKEKFDRETTNQDYFYTDSACGKWRELQLKL